MNNAIPWTFWEVWFCAVAGVYFIYRSYKPASAFIRSDVEKLKAYEPNNQTFRRLGPLMLIIGVVQIIKYYCFG